MKTRKWAMNGHVGPSEILLLLGSTHRMLGGPARTIGGYVAGLDELSVAARVGAESPVAEITKALDIDSSRVAYGFGGTPIKRFGRIWRFAGAVRSTSVIAVVGVWHLTFFTVGLRAVLWRLVRRGNRPSVVLIPTASLTAGDYKRNRLKKIGLSPVVAMILLALDGVVFSSSGERTNSRPRTWRSSVVVLEPTVAAGIADRETRRADSRNRRIDVVAVGRVVPEKDIPMFLQAIAKVETASTVQVIGDGERHYVDELRRQADALGLADRIEWTGWLPHSEVLERMQMSRVLAVTSLSENYCHVAVEAACAGAEVVMVDRIMSATDLGRLRGIVVCDSDPDSVARAIRGVMERSDEIDSADVELGIAVSDVCAPGVAAQQLLAFLAAAKQAARVGNVR